MKRKIIASIAVILIIIVATTLLVLPEMTFAAPNYGEAMGKAIMFFDANRCGPDVATNNVFSWRGACHTSDKDGSVDLTGGFHDAGDHVKFGLPAAFSASCLGWSLYEFKSEYDAAGATTKTLSTLKLFTDYFMKSFTGSTFYYEVGDGGADHSYWGPPEDQTGSRPVWKGTPPDIGGQTAGALALMSINYKSVDSSYSTKCLTAAKNLYNLCKNTTERGFGGDFYKSSSHLDDLTWAAIWLYKATGDDSYLANVPTWIEAKNDQGDDPYKKQWTYCWDDSTLANLILYSEIAKDRKYVKGVEWNLDWFCNTLQKTPYGLPYLNNWGVLRYDSAEAGLAYIMYKKFGNKDALTTANKIIDYCLGTNPSGMCYLTNYGSNSAKHPHHRANEPVRGGATKGMVGGLVGGPNNNDSYTDDVNSYEFTEVALDYNASFLLGCAGRSYVARGGAAGTPIPLPSPAPTSAPGNGNGLSGQYFQGTTASGTPLLTRIDPQIDFSWGGGSPDASVPSDTFSAKWTGQIEARSTEKYTFIMNHDDGARLTINNQVVIDSWGDKIWEDDMGTINLEMGKKYNIVVEYFENGGDANMVLEWETYSLPREVVPKSQLYTSATATTQVPTTTIAPTTIIPTTTATTTVPTTVPTTSQVSPSVTTSTQSPTSGTLSATYTIINSWSNGATINVSIKNNSSSAKNNWTTTWTFNSSEKISNLWNGKYTQSGSSVSVTNESYNATIPANGTVSFGFNLTSSGTTTAPTNIKVS